LSKHFSKMLAIAVDGVQAKAHPQRAACRKAYPTGVPKFGVDWCKRRRATILAPSRKSKDQGVASERERRVRNAEVEGSIPFVSTKYLLPTTLRRRFHFHGLNAARLRSRRTATESARF